MIGSAAACARGRGISHLGGAWRHIGAREGFEVLFLARAGEGLRFDGHSTGIEEGALWSVSYSIVVDERWATRSARIRGRSQRGEHELLLEGDGAGSWQLDGRPAPEFDGLLDVDLEASAVTNALPVRRLALAPGERAEAPAVWVRALDLSLERLEQTYQRLDDEDGRARYDYLSPAHDFRSLLVYDEHGLVLDYPGMATRVG